MEESMLDRVSTDPDLSLPPWFINKGFDKNRAWCIYEDPHPDYKHRVRCCGYSVNPNIKGQIKHYVPADVAVELIMWRHLYYEPKNRSRFKAFSEEEKKALAFMAISWHIHKKEPGMRKKGLTLELIEERRELVAELTPDDTEDIFEASRRIAAKLYDELPEKDQPALQHKPYPRKKELTV